MPATAKEARAKLRKFFERAPYLADPANYYGNVPGCGDLTWGDLLALATSDPAAEVTEDGSRICPPGAMLLPQSDDEARVMNCVSERFINSEAK